MKLLSQNQLNDYTIFTNDLMEELNGEFSGSFRFYFVRVSAYIHSIEYYDNTTGLYNFIYIKYGHIEFVDVPEEIVNYVIQFTNCNSYIVRNDDIIIKYHSMMSLDNVWILLALDKDSLYYKVYIDNEYALSLEYNRTLQLMGCYSNVDAVKIIFQLIDEVIDCRTYVAHEHKSLFNEYRKWIPEDVFRPQFLD